MWKHENAQEKHLDYESKLVKTNEETHSEYSDKKPTQQLSVLVLLSLQIHDALTVNLYKASTAKIALRPPLCSLFPFPLPAIHLSACFSFPCTSLFLDSPSPLHSGRNVWGSMFCSGWAGLKPLTDLLHCVAEKSTVLGVNLLCRLVVHVQLLPHLSSMYQLEVEIDISSKYTLLIW